ncbi:hypothetical protein [Saccharicrinis sp. 156]|uniref:hypothetical protein n=1 Tax=Saccharicrinis sp. 156 TaxID=3417574 RepID=UPI003D33770C
MLKKELTYAAYFILFLAGISISACSPLSFPAGNETSFHWKNNKKNKKPKVVLSEPADCPCDKTYVIKNTPKRKLNGASYAKKQNRKLKKALPD